MFHALALIIVLEVVYIMYTTNTSNVAILVAYVQDSI